MKLGISSYSFQQCFENGTLDELSLIDKVAELGFVSLEYPDFNLRGQTHEARCELARAIRDKANALGIDVSAYVVGANLLQDSEDKIEAEVERVKRELDIAAILGSVNFRFDVIYSKLPMMQSFEGLVERIAPAIRKIADYGKSLGIMTMIENHGLTFEDYVRMEKTHHIVSHENFGILIDTGNFLFTDEDNVRCVSNLAHLCAHVHLKDMSVLDYYSPKSKQGYEMTRGANYIKGVSLGEGDAKVEQCLMILKNAGYDGYVHLEYEGPEDCLACIERSIRFLKNNVKECFNV